ncbi:ATP-binding cassette domain-containing protein [Bifidobacterium sp. ESL0690]|uniref:ATP-binding cassette domain-containing protein n=1 Tax=Bifidobacterium sp. ESL0690 TaxID=2983214 RepID=UPI0023F6F64E|nr:ATP-binding cassette domain-containing protein [Bifidobacterium sp. ESL0690]WEV46374.1 ATP-binding cassette domain-containing protein [Bifidobacterium sp. ESL0690]
MFDRRLFTLVPRSGAFVAAKVLSLWVSLLADIGFAFIAVGLLGNLFPVLTSANDNLKPAVLKKLLRDFQAVPQGYSAFVFALVMVAIIKYLAIRASHFFGTEASERVKIALRERLYNKMLDLGPTYSEHVKTADVVQSLGEGVDHIQSFFEAYLPQLVFAVLAPLTLFVAILPLNAPTAALLLVCVPIIVGIVWWVSVATSRAFGQYWDSYTDMGATFLDNVQGLETLKTFDADEAAAKRMNGKSEEFRKTSMKVLHLELRARLALDLVSFGATAGGIAIIVWQVASGHLKLPAALVAILLSVSFFVPLRKLASCSDTAMNGVAAIKRIYAMLDVPVSGDGQSALPQGVEDCSITFRNVDYTYKPITSVVDSGAGDNDSASIEDIVSKNDNALNSDAAAKNAADSKDSNDSEAHKALDGVSFTARANGFTAIVGVSGSGKSTVGALIAGTRNDYEGSIRLGYRVLGSVGSCELHSLKNRSLCDAVTLVDSRSHLFTGSLRENLLMAKPDATANEMWLALEGAHIDDFVYSQPQRLDMRIEQDASNLSGGQRQRLAIARALLRESPIYVFDEATSSVDAESEALIDVAIRDLARTRTVIVITHRLTQARDANNIVVLDGGRVVESGTHDELMSSHGRYATMFETQASIEHVSHRNSWGSAYAKPQPANPKVRRPFDFALLDYQSHDDFDDFDNRSSRTRDSERSGTQTQQGRQTRHRPAAAAGKSAKTEAARAHAATLKAAVGSAKRAVSAAAQTSARKSGSASSGVYNSAPAAAGSRHSNGTRSYEPAKRHDESDAILDVANRPHGENKQMGTFHLTLRLLGCVGRLTPFVVGASLCGTIARLAETFMPVFGVLALMAVFGHPVWGVNVAFALIAAAVCAIAKSLMHYAEEYMNHEMSFRVVSLFRSKAFEALRRLAPAKLARRGKGDLTTLVTSDVELLETFFAHAISPVIIALTTSVVIAVALFTLDPWFALLLIVAHLFVGVALPRLYAGNVRGIGARIRNDSAKLGDRLVDDMHGMDEIIRFNQGRRRLTDIIAEDKNLWLFESRLSRKDGVFGGLGAVSVIVATFIAVRVMFGIVTADPVSMAMCVVAVMIIFSSFGPTLALSDLPGNLNQPLAAARRMFALFDEVPAVEETGKDKPKFETVSLQDVTFGYPLSSAGSTSIPASALVLKDFNFTTLHSGILGVQGPSGHGKSTILKLLMRYWDPQEGSVDFSGEPLPNVEAHYRRRVETMMDQDTYLFDGTIRDNLLVADPRATDSEMYQALQRASIDTVIEALPDGLNTQVGELGSRLSEGERQRISLARIFLTGASLVLFDEPTSRVDALNESVILHSINTLADERPVSIVLVSHRASTMQIADRVITL